MEDVSKNRGFRTRTKSYLWTSTNVTRLSAMIAREEVKVKMPFTYLQEGNTCTIT